MALHPNWISYYFSKTTGHVAFKDGCLLGCSAVKSQVHAASIIRDLMMEAARSSEKLVNFYQTTRRYNPEDSHLHTRRRENFKPHV
jgi:hypothetical protein